MQYFGLSGSNTIQFGKEYLSLRLDLANHSPSGFSWGYCGSGPAQSALAILSHFLQDDNEALNRYQEFKEKIIARQPVNGNLVIDISEITDFLKNKG
jgi:hypothetical protein